MLMKVIYSLKSNNEIRNISDLRGKRIGFGHMYSTGSFHLGAEVLSHGAYSDSSFFESKPLRDGEVDA